MLESVTGRPVHWLAYPYGQFSHEAIEMASEAGYRSAFACTEALNDGIPHPFAVRRIGVDDNMTFAGFIVAVSGLREFMKRLLGVARPFGVAGGAGSDPTVASPHASGRAVERRSPVGTGLDLGRDRRLP